VRPDHRLHREAEVDLVAVGARVGRLQLVQERRAVVPVHVVGRVDDVVALQRRDGNERDVLHVQLLGEGLELGHDLAEAFLAVVHEVHLVDRDDHVRDLQERRDEAVALRLLQHAVARVDELHGQLGRRGASDHVARVLLVARRVGDDELALRRGEVAVRHVDGDALLALRAEAVGQERQLQVLVRPVRVALDLLHLLLEDLLRVVHEPPDEGRLAVVHAAGGGESKYVHAVNCELRFSSCEVGHWSLVIESAAERVPITEQPITE
jgi:hypothetical protein